MIKIKKNQIKTGLAYLNYWITLLSLWAVSLHAYDKVLTPLLFSEWLPTEIKLLRGIIFTLGNQYALFQFIVPILAIQACLAMIRHKHGQINRWGIFGACESLILTFKDICQTSSIKTIACLSLICLVMPAPFQLILSTYYPWPYMCIIEIGGILANGIILADSWYKNSSDDQALLAWAVTSLVIIIGNGKHISLNKIVNTGNWFCIDQYCEFALLSSYHLYQRRADNDYENPVSSSMQKMRNKTEADEPCGIDHEQRDDKAVLEPQSCELT